MEARLMANSVLDIVTECWVWISSRDKRASTPYGKINLYMDGKVKTFQVHRVSYMTFKGEIPEGYEVDHTCRNTYCINPAHLEAVTPTVNKDRRVFA
jgi:hypothetical protein